MKCVLFYPSNIVCQAAHVDDNKKHQQQYQQQQQQHKQ